MHLRQNALPNIIRKWNIECLPDRKRCIEKLASIRSILCTLVQPLRFLILLHIAHITRKGNVCASILNSFRNSAPLFTEFDVSSLRLSFKGVINSCMTTWVVVTTSASSTTVKEIWSMKIESLAPIRM